MDDGYPSLLPRPSVSRQGSVSYRHFVREKRENPKKGISTVKDGYGQAAALFGTDLVDGTSVEVLVADDSLIDEAVSRGFLCFRFIRDGDPYERVFAGKSFLRAYRHPPKDVAQQVRTLKAVKEMVPYLSLQDAIAGFDEDDGGTPFNRDDVD
jgi:hypothetical protein